MELENGSTALDLPKIMDLVAHPPTIVMIEITSAKIKIKMYE